MLFANEAPKMLQYFMPAIGTAPKWCSYLETITEELEETEQPAGIHFAAAISLYAYVAFHFLIFSLIISAAIHSVVLPLPII